MRKWSLVMVSAFLLLCPFLWGTDLQAAEKFPNKPITFIIPIEAGGGGDIQVRPLAAQVGTLIGQPLVVVNKPGAGSSIGYREIHDSKPNGYTFGVGMATIVANKLQGLLPYDFRDFTMLGGYMMAVPALMASTKGKRNFKTLQELVEFAKKHPDEVTVASGGKGQSWWIASVEFFKKAGIKVKIIPQEGAGGFSVAQVAGGHVDLACAGLAEAKPQIDAGNARLLAAFGPRRPFAYPDVPTLKELGYDCKTASLVSCVGPPGIPKDIVEILVKAIETAAKNPEYKKFLEERNNSISLYQTPEQAFATYSDHRAMFREILGQAGLLKDK
jgi:tripartite-type tricarboxylate transporter receptor subunit TctC